MEQSYLTERLKALSEGFGMHLPEEVLKKVISFSDFKDYSKGETIAREGEKASVAGIILNGVVRSYYVDREGYDITQWFSAEGNWCIDSGLIGFEEMKANWEAIEDSTIMIFRVKDLKELIRNNEALMGLWIDSLESGMRYKVYRENGFLTETATERYLSFCVNYPGLSERVPLRYIATYLGITPESLSRIRSALKNKK